MRGERLRLLRVERGYSRRRLAIELGVGVAGIARWENETQVPRIDTVKRIADFFDVSVDWLTGLSDRKSPNRD